MHILNTIEMNQVSGGIYSELLFLTTFTTIGFLSYQMWWALNQQTADLSDHQSDAYYDGAMLYLSNGAHCA